MATTSRLKACGGLAPYIWTVVGPGLLSNTTGTAVTVSCASDSATAVVVTVTDSVGISVSHTVDGSCACVGCDYELGTRTNFVGESTCDDCGGMESMTYVQGTTVKFFERQVSTGTKTVCTNDICPNLGPITATIRGYLCNVSCSIFPSTLTDGILMRLRLTSAVGSELIGGSCTNVTINGAEFPVSWTLFPGVDNDVIPAEGTQCVITSEGGTVLCLPECE